MGKLKQLERRYSVLELENALFQAYCDGHIKYVDIMDDNIAAPIYEALKRAEERRTK